jgi:hypothetical protein
MRINTENIVFLIQKKIFQITLRNPISFDIQCTSASTYSNGIPIVHVFHLENISDSLLSAPIHKVFIMYPSKTLKKSFLLKGEMTL